jgi:hypothetical protein
MKYIQYTLLLLFLWNMNTWTSFITWTSFLRPKIEMFKALIKKGQPIIDFSFLLCIANKRVGLETTFGSLQIGRFLLRVVIDFLWNLVCLRGNRARGVGECKKRRHLFTLSPRLFPSQIVALSHYKFPNGLLGPPCLPHPLLLIMVVIAHTCWKEGPGITMHPHFWPPFETSNGWIGLFLEFTLRALV